LACDPYRGASVRVQRDPRAAADAIRPRDARGHRLRAAALLQAGALEAARDEARLARAGRPLDGEAWWIEAEAERRAGRRGAALDVLDRAGGAIDDEPAALSLRAQLIVERTESLLHPPPAPSPTDPIFADVTARLAAGDAPGGVARLLDWTAEPVALHTRGPAAEAFLAAHGRTADAVTLADRIIAEDPRDATARLDQAHVLLAAGRVARALQVIDDAIYVAADRKLALERAARLLEETGHGREACALLGRALAFREGATELDALAGCLERQGRMDAARAVRDRACAADPACASATGTR
jgi:tetratricopeptide (TPR) repeat protein